VFNLFSLITDQAIKLLIDEEFADLIRKKEEEVLKNSVTIVAQNEYKLELITFKKLILRLVKIMEHMKDAYSSALYHESLTFQKERLLMPNHSKITGPLATMTSDLIYFNYKVQGYIHYAFEIGRSVAPTP